MTVVDTFYEFLGYSLAQGITDVIQSLWIPLIVSSCGCVYAFVTASERGEPRRIVGYLLYLALIIWLISPVTVPFGNPHIVRSNGNPREGYDIEIQAPRALYVANEAMDTAMNSSLSIVNHRFAMAPFEWERIARMVHTARIREPLLAQRYQAYLHGCYNRLLARLPSEWNVPDPLGSRTGSLYREEDSYLFVGKMRSCRSAVPALLQEFSRHIRKDPYHSSILQAAREFDGGQGFESAYLRSISISEWLAPHLRDSEGSRVARSLGTLQPMEGKGYKWWQTLPLVSELYPKAKWGFVKDVFGALGILKQDFVAETEPRQKYYLVLLYGPHLYGLVLVFLIGLFPIVAMWALVPGGWKAFLNYGKVFLSVKLWPVMWAALSKISDSRSSMEAVDPVPGMVNMRDVYLAVIAMYLLTPALTFLVVQLSTRAAAAAVSQAVPNPAGAVSPMTVVNVAAARGRAFGR